MSKIITCDFDETLATTISTAWGGTALVPVKNVINFVKSKIITNKYTVYIVTFRSQKQIYEVINFVKQYDIQIKDIIFTSGQSKIKYIKELNSILHIDDHRSTCLELLSIGIDSVCVEWDKQMNDEPKFFFLSNKQKND
jgi:hypothetical protein